MGRPKPDGSTITPNDKDNPVTDDTEQTHALTTTERARGVLGFAAAQEELQELAAQSTGITEITNKAGYDQCHAARMVLKNRRLEIQRTGKTAREDAQAYAKAVIGVEKELVGIIEPEEGRLAALQEQWDTARERERQEAERAEAERVQRQQDAIATITGALGKLFGASVAQLQLALDQLDAFDMDQFDAVFRPAAEQARAEAVAAIARARDERQELDRQAEAVRQQQEELEAQRRRDAEAAQQREAAERRQRQVQTDIDAITRAAFAQHGSTADLQAHITTLAGRQLDAETFGDRLQEAEDARAQALATLNGRLQTAIEQDNRQRQLDEQAAEQRQRDEEDARERQQAAEREAAARREQEQAEAERAAAAAAQAETEARRRAAMHLLVAMPDGSTWRVPLMAVVESHAAYYASRDHGGDLAASIEDTLRLFESDASEAQDWAQGNMNWDEVAPVATLHSPPAAVDYQEGWVNGEMQVVIPKEPQA